MKVTVQRKQLADFVRNAKPLYPKQSPNNLIKIQAESGSVQFSAADTTSYYTQTIPRAVDEPGTCYVETNKLPPLLKGLDYIVITEKSLTSAGFTIKTSSLWGHFPENNFSVDKKPDKISRFARGTIPEILEKVLYAASRDVSRRALNGVFVKTNNLETVAVAADSHRLAEYKITDFNDEMSCLIPRKVCLVAVKAFPGGGESTMMIHHDIVRGDLVKLENQTTSLVFLTEGANFPDYAEVIPGDGTHVAEICFRSEKILPALKGFAGMISNKEKKGVTVTHADGVTTFSFDDGETSGAEIIESHTKAAEDCTTEFRINPTYLAEAIQQMGGEEVYLRYTNEYSPILVVGGAYNNRAVVMPMRI